MKGLLLFLSDGSERSVVSLQCQCNTNANTNTNATIYVNAMPQLCLSYARPLPDLRLRINRHKHKTSADKHYIREMQYMWQYVWHWLRFSCHTGLGYVFEPTNANNVIQKTRRANEKCERRANKMCLTANQKKVLFHTKLYRKRKKNEMIGKRKEIEFCIQDNRLTIGSHNKHKHIVRVLQTNDYWGHWGMPSKDAIRLSLDIRLVIRYQFS